MPVPVPMSIPQVPRPASFPSRAATSDLDQVTRTANFRQRVNRHAANIEHHLGHHESTTMAVEQRQGHEDKD
ncbi:hypothetical protein E4U43_004982 [Claviceps pusilla]|uniref:Uncharacterized protein n=1 Tax=Claviceps pusilla TaxID=123648 RepID=A0A9P7SWM7_9HYPO|nr:hypothetical protein E4U43_004982 [Claviceps pusilla]